MKKYQMGEARDTHGGSEKYVQGSVADLKDRDHWDGFGLGETVTVIWSIKERLGQRVVD
jgi:hypothetical protein